jgi:ABC-type branched-subunit amino acid transport system ATPase component
VLLLDEPFSGLDVKETEQVLAGLARMVTEHDVSLLLVEHDVAVVLGVSTTVYVLDFGILIADGPPQQIRNNPAVRTAYLGGETAPGGRSKSEAPSVRWGRGTD